jgi:two-component system CAI-1 autoinducer sensor kinase/phosphatase CqsS
MPPVLDARLKRLQASGLQWLLRQGQEQDQLAVRLRFLAWIGCLGMPLYYLVWTVAFPQHYESLGLRLLGVVLCLPALFLPRLPKVFTARHLRIYEFVGVTYVLPFFFTFMFLKNYGATVWGESLLVALIVLFQFDSLWALASWACGTAIAGIAFALAGDPAFLTHPLVLEQAPIYLFTVLVVSVTRVGRQVLAREKLAGMAQALAMVSHELRTPLISVAANVRGIERALKTAPAPAREAAPADAQRAVAVNDAMARIGFEVRHMNQMIDLFLLSAAALNQQLVATEEVSMAEVVTHVLERYPFAADAQRNAVDVVVRADFTFSGKHELCVVVLLNLLRNALKALQRAGRGQVRIVVDGARARPRLLVMDSGCGIAARQLPYIFERFYSWPPSSGAGIGLALCKDIVHAWEGRIRCRSRESAYTVFALEFTSINPCPSPSISTRP